MKRKVIQSRGAHLLDGSIIFPGKVDNFSCLPDEGRAPIDGEFKQALEAKYAQFVLAHDKARRIIGPKPRLAYRLDLETEDLKTDQLYASKIGGRPDLCATESIGRYLLKGSSDKFEFPTVGQFVAKNWPRCPVCLRPMRFLAQINLWDWFTVIHQLTGHEEEKGHGRCWERWHSALGYGQTLLQYGLSQLAGKHLMIWHCSSSCSFGLESRVRCQWSNNGLIALSRKKMLRKLEIRLWHAKPAIPAPTSDQAIDMFGDGFPWTIAEYCRAVDSFAEGETRLQINGAFERNERDENPGFVRVVKHGQVSRADYPIILSPSKRIVDAKIGFDPDDMSYEDWPGNPIFHAKSAFVLFGTGRSQQEPRNPFCPEPYGGAHRMAPLIAYDEPEQDLTHQIYTCLACGSAPYGGFNNSFPGVLDSSCT
jgi:hypothetical protein